MIKLKISRLSEILALTRQNEHKKAEPILARFIADKFDIRSVKSLKIRKDNISLNSVNGTFEDGSARRFFFKFHLEENEADTLDEYYKAELLSKVGYAVELPLFISRDVGEQILIYPYVEYERLFDVCRRIEQGAESETENIIAAQADMDRMAAEKCIATLTLAKGEDYIAEPLLQLFYWRLVDKQPDGTYLPGGRFKSFYLDKDFTFQGLELPYAELSPLKWNINGVPYAISLGEAFENARNLLAPDSISEYPACIAHGDAHNGNVWVKPDEKGKVTFSYFDPAFASEKMPVLLAEIKSTFHNIFAHPDWLYQAAEAEKKLNISAEIKDGTLYVQHNWKLTNLRQRFLDSKKNLFWIPVLQELKKRKWLPANWQDFMRAALFCCPTLVMNLRAGTGTNVNMHTLKTSLLGLSIAMMCASTPISGDDIMSDFFNSLGRTLEGEV